MSAMASMSCIAAAALVAAPAASAQSMYRCKSGNSTYLSDRPCTSGAGSTLGTIGTAPSPTYPQPSGTYVQRAPKAAEHVGYLSSACADIAEAIRTGPSRGVRGDVIGGLHEEYRQKCSEDDAAARQRVAEDRRNERDTKRAAQSASQQQQQQARIASDQCNELLRILAAKRRQTATMSDGERADLQRSEASYAERCKQ
ncbi:hypothetical protein ASE08_08760 [Rhizobacter sp. Root16D2]|nr:hypothetical protein ASC88_14685 [Rhizobacter sp. Root29]KQW04340.1 hypothetical protein ASC98_04375 [Rhizobacter sp. Root1238]KRB14528.1 hypothetical protein ASE08_08760 [Rhizobacter sp. Root16D2]